MLPTRANKKISPTDLQKLALRLQDRQKILILNNPNNPTGLLYDRLELEEIADICREQNIVVISDEIYAQTTFNFSKFVLKIYAPVQKKYPIFYNHCFNNSNVIQYYSLHRVLVLVSLLYHQI